MTYGHHDVDFRPMTLSFSEVLDRQNCINFWGGDDSYSIYYQHGEITHEVIGAAQIDKYGDVNNIEIRKLINHGAAGEKFEIYSAKMIIFM